MAGGEPVVLAEDRLWRRMIGESKKITWLFRTSQQWCVIRKWPLGYGRHRHLHAVFHPNGH